MPKDKELAVYDSVDAANADLDDIEQLTALVPVLA
jgi:hypothetical protein